MKRLFPLLLIPLVLVGVSFGASDSDTMGGLCNIMGKIEAFAPVAVKVFAFIVLIVGLGAGGFMIVDRERNMMGRGIVVAGISIVFFSLLWVLATPLQDVITAGKTALGCS